MRRDRPHPSVVSDALACYSFDRPVARRLGRGFNAMYRVDTADGARFALRVQRVGFGVDVVSAELAWLEAIRRDTDLAVPDPVRTLDNDLVCVTATPSGPRLVVVFRWLTGRFLDAGLRAGHLHQMGALAAQLQAHGARFTPSAAAPRGRVDAMTDEGRHRPDPFDQESQAEVIELLGRHLGTDVRAPVSAVIERVRLAQQRIGFDATVFGLQHGDLHQENVLFRRAGIAAIDFDDCGHAPHAYDLAVTVLEIRDRPDYPELRTALVAGFRTMGSLSDREEAAIDVLMVLRLLQLTVWQVRQLPSIGGPADPAVETERTEIIGYLHRLAMRATEAV
jgi:Ser/Thr protein kinase RdoA (MazF antagonist)